MEIGGMDSSAGVRMGYSRQERVSRETRPSQGDTVSLSSEAKRLMEYFRNKEVHATDREAESATASTETSPEGLAHATQGGAVGAAQGASSGSGSGSGSQVEDIKKRIKDLMDKVEHIMDGNLPPEQKQSAAAPYLQQISELQQQLQQLMSEQQT
ncbi:MAG: FlxA-like family protein [Desulfomicrobium sp.]